MSFDFGIGLLDLGFLDEIVLDFLGWESSVRGFDSDAAGQLLTFSSVCPVGEIGRSNREAFAFLLVWFFHLDGMSIPNSFHTHRCVGFAVDYV